MGGTEEERTCWETIRSCFCFSQQRETNGANQEIGQVVLRRTEVPTSDLRHRQTVTQDVLDELKSLSGGMKDSGRHAEKVPRCLRCFVQCFGRCFTRKKNEEKEMKNETDAGME